MTTTSKTVVKASMIVASESVRVFNLIAKRVYDSADVGVLFKETGGIAYAVTEKQYNWLINVICKEFKNYDGISPIGFSDSEFDYTVDPKKKHANAPFYIADFKKYGFTHIITKIKKKSILI